MGNHSNIFSMSLADLTPETLRELLTLSEKKETLLAQIAKLDSQFEAIASGKSSAPVAVKPAKIVKAPKAPKAGKVEVTRQRRSGVKDAILAALTGKPDGVSVLELAKITGSKIPSLHTFFATTGKNIPGLKKVGRGVWAYHPVVATAGEAPETPIAPVAPVPEVAISESVADLSLQN